MSADRPNCGKRLIGYLTNVGEREMTDVQGASLTHLILTYLTIDKDLNFIWRYPDHYKTTVQKAKSSYPNLKFMVSIGGWNDDSSILSAYLNDSSQRELLCDKICQYLMDQKLDGIEIQWEYNVQTSLQVKVERDKQNYMAFLVELREKLRSLPRPQLLTIVAAQNPQDFFFMNRQELGNVLELVDFINVKTYDYYGTWSYLTGPPGPLFDGLPPGQLQSTEGKYVDWTMRYYGCRTSQLNKLNLVLSFVGYSWESKGFPLLIDDGTMDDNDDAKSEYGMWRAARTPFKGSVLRWPMAPYIYDRANGLFFGFENERSILAKLDYVRKFGIGGITLNAVDFDDDEDSLVKLIKRNLNEMACNESVIPYNCTPKQDEQCIKTNGICTMEHLCENVQNDNGNNSDANTKPLYLSSLNKCHSSILDDIICCTRQQSNNFTQITGINSDAATLMGTLKTATTTTSPIFLLLTPILLLSFLGLISWLLKRRCTKYNRVVDEYVTLTSLRLNLSNCPELDPTNVEIIQKQNVKRGNEGDVFEGILKSQCAEKPSQRVAIKVCRKGIYQMEDLENEIRLLATCSHKNVITFLGYYYAAIGNQFNVPHIVTEFMDGGTLEELCCGQSKQKIDLSKLMDILSQICDGMAYMAEMRLVHRDLTPQNCVLSSRMERVKIIDFGLCRHIEEYRNDRCRVFQPRYTALECLDSSNKFSEKTDIWSFGVLVWRVTTLMNPYSWLRMDAEALRIELQKFLTAGNRLERKDKRGRELCPADIYNTLIAPCWLLNAISRPRFKQMHEAINLLMKDRLNAMEYLQGQEQIITNL